MDENDIVINGLDNEVLNDTIPDFNDANINNIIDDQYISLNNIRDSRLYEFKSKLEVLINSCGIDNDLNTPEFILVDYIVSCLDNFKRTNANREGFFGR